MADFDIVTTYRNLLASDPDLTMPVAAIESLVELLAHSHASTVSETLDLLNDSIKHLKRSIPNSISLSAGTDLFQRYLITTINPRPTSSGSSTGPGDFRTIRQHLISNGRLFVTRAKASRENIAAFGRHFVRDGTTVLTNGGSRVVGALLRRAAEDNKGSVRFRVIYVLPSSAPKVGATANSTEGQSTITTLRELGVPVATISEGAVGYALGEVDMVIVGAEGVVENGGIISRLGTYQLGLLARAAAKPFYVVAESHKFVRLYPLGQYDLGIEQKIVEFQTTEEHATKADTGRKIPSAIDEKSDKSGYFDNTLGDGKRRQDGHEGPHPEEIGGTIQDAVDFTPPDLISALITESGVLTPSAVSEELIKIWF
ncbi:MAG: translation initiation factor eIF-2B subunit alpha [Sclerophora amabilis]|nr:MAG: translation initiation factor eIF-2B subunit alpha [Sclerophora amabilis]